MGRREREDEASKRQRKSQMREVKRDHIRELDAKRMERERLLNQTRCYRRSLARLCTPICGRDTEVASSENNQN